MAMLLDTALAAVEASSVSRVFVVTSDPVVASTSRTWGIETIPDEGADLNSAIEAALARLANAPVLVMTGDLPCLRTWALEAVLTDASQSESAFVSDATGNGTTVITSVNASKLRPRFGDLSASLHRELGMTDLPADECVRLDVDTRDDLGRAINVGVGSRTSAVVSSLGKILSS